MLVQVEGISHRGEGVARINGKAVFIPYAIPGEQVQVEIERDHKRFARGRLVGLGSASPDRVEPICPAYYDCGGCAYQHLSYSKELELKRRVVGDNLRRLGGIETEVQPVIGMPDPWRYRNKVVWHTGKINGRMDLGFYREASHNLVPLHGCTLIHKDMELIQKSLADNLSALEVEPGVDFTLRRSSRTGHMSLIYSGNCNKQALISWALSLPGKVSIHIKQANGIETFHGDTYLEEQLCGIVFRLSPLAFLQVNHQQTEKLYQLILQYGSLKGNEQVLDAFCGVGTITLSLAGHASQVTGVELYPGAIEDAKHNAVINNIHNVDFYAGPCESIIAKLNQQFDVVVLDPPRAGCQKKTIQAIVKTGAKRIIYVSCNPSTLARDLKVFTSMGYVITTVQPVDMFPQTHHVECVVLMSRVEK
ncbi:23S rRNA (uracil(1939)-C(5))-methyltransferase RlmD [Syntrophomonas erecta]